jgi:hypothetical protein
MQRIEGGFKPITLLSATLLALIEAIKFADGVSHLLASLFSLILPCIVLRDKGMNAKVMTSIWIAVYLKLAKKAVFDLFVEGNSFIELTKAVARIKKHAVGKG